MYPVRILDNGDGGWISHAESKVSRADAGEWGRGIENNVSRANPGEWEWGMDVTYRK